jgi:hypothetical protein
MVSKPRRSKVMYLYRVSWYTGGPVRDFKARSKTDRGFRFFLQDAYRNTETSSALYTCFKSTRCMP